MNNEHQTLRFHGFFLNVPELGDICIAWPNEINAPIKEIIGKNMGTYFQPLSREEMDKFNDNRSDIESRKVGLFKTETEYEDNFEIKKDYDFLQTEYSIKFRDNNLITCMQKMEMLLYKDNMRIPYRILGKFE